MIESPSSSLSPTPEQVDVLVIGAGINGAGLFRDLCEQGVTCLIIDKGDFGAGTSAAPSRLIHGGLKYLETGEFRLVAQSTLERNLLLANAPHMVTPLATIIPIFSWMKGVTSALRTLFGSTTAPRSRGALLIKIGLSLYDFYGSRHRMMPRHRMFSRAGIRAEMPMMTDRIVAAGEYYDARIARPERLVYELVRDGLTAHPASRAENHATLVGQTGGIVDIRCADGQHLRVRPQIVINAAGPWIDQVNAVLGQPTRMIGGTKGSHILMDHPELVRQLNGRMIYFEADDGRILLVYDHHGKALVGSTDIKASNPDDIRCEDWEIDYFLTALKSLLPGLAFSRSQITYAYAGIRPLPASDAAIPGLISRDHSTPELAPEDSRPFPVIALVGGKWTTFRGFAEEVADSVLTRLGKARRVSTRTLAIGGGKAMPSSAEGKQDMINEIADRADISKDRARVLFERYGTTARDIAGFTGQSHKTMIEGTPDYSAAEIGWIAAHEKIIHLSDLVFQRLTFAIDGKVTPASLAHVASIVGQTLGWDEARQKTEISIVVDRLARKHRVTLQTD